MKGEGRMTGNARKMKVICMQMKGNGRNMHANESKINRTTPRSISEPGMDFGRKLDLEFADFHKTLESDRDPQQR